MHCACSSFSPLYLSTGDYRYLIVYEARDVEFFILLQAQVVHNCKRLCLEFMHYIIESRSLRKVRRKLSLPAVVISPTCGVCVGVSVH